MSSSCNWAALAEHLETIAKALPGKRKQDIGMLLWMKDHLASVQRQAWAR